MIQVNYVAIVVGTLLAITFSALYYFILNKKVVAYRSHGHSENEVRTTISINRLLVEIVRTFVLGLVIAYAVSLLNLLALNQALLMAFWLWLGFPVVLLTGLVMHERVSLPLVMVHAGDWLAKILIFSVILTLWR